MGEQRRQLFLTGGFAEGAAQNTDQPGVDLEIAASLLNPGNYRLYHAVDRQPVGHRHIAGREAQLNVVQAISRRVFDVLIRHAATGFQRGQDLYPPVELGEETNQIGLKAGDLDMRTQRVEGGCGKSDIKFAAKIEDGLGPDVTVKMTMNVG